ncbi:hypothetical protein BX600DRAFT_484751 [Xylariales sp. PMI_506]|nr:hypothetical protein BX600DRAFT_484751 [Xylariales sp. PMI_506]
MCVIVTGGAGFIGTHLVERLLSEGRRVVVLDSVWTGSPDNIDKFKGNDNFSFIQCDIRDPLPALEQPSEIYHLACPASPDQFEETPVEILETCFEGTKNIFDLAVRSKARVLIASTSEIYGDPKVVPQSEKYWGNTNSFGPRACYDEGKRVIEALAYGYQRQHGLEVRLARIFNAYGPSMRVRDGRAVPNFIASALEGRAMPIYGDGSATRCFQFVTDCVAGLMALMASDYSGPVNIGSDVETRVDEIAEMVREIVCAKTGNDMDGVVIDYRPAREDDPYRRKPDISLAKRVLHWQPKVSLRNGLEETVDYFLQNQATRSRN